jgi:hypothetical protein
MADEYELGTVGPIPTTNPNVAKIGEMLKLAKKYADQYYVKDYVPLIGGTTLGDFLLGKAPEEVERWGQGDYPFRNPNEVVGTGGNRADIWKTGRFEPTFDVAANVALPGVGTAQLAAKPLARTLGPKAAEMAEDYLTKQGAILNIVEPSPKKVVEPFSAIDELGFHSPLENAILKIQQPKGTGDQFLKQLEKTPGVKTEELDVTGIKQYLLDHPTVTKQELLDQMATSRLKLEQKVLGKTTGEDAYGNYQLRGGEVFDDEDYISSLADDFHYDMKSDDVIRNQERQALLEADPERYADNLATLEDDIDNVLYENAKQQANDMYYDNPIRHYYDDHGYDIYGNDDMGYSVKDPNGRFLELGGRNGIYDIDDAEEALRQHLLDEGVFYIDDGGAKFEDYTLPGKYENYREVLTTLPSQSAYMKANMDMFEFRKEVNKRLDKPTGGWDYEELTPQEQMKYDILNERMLRADKNKNEYQSGHFDEPNILAHTRLNDRIINGKKTLMVEEIQSDWHQAGRRKGYASEASKERKAEIEYQLGKLNTDKSLLRDYRDAAGEQGNLVQKLDYDQQLARLERQQVELRSELQGTSGVPDAPFKKNWHELMMKQILNEAVKGNYDAVAFTTGRQQAERYNLSKQIDSLELLPSLSSDDIKPLRLKAYKDGNQVISRDIDESELPDLIGKEAAKKLLEQPEGKYRDRVLSGVEMDVGGEGMKGFYDKILPDYINKYGKKYGIGVKKANLPYKGVPSADDVYANAKNYGYSKEQFDKLPIEEQKRIMKEVLPKGEEVHFFDLSDMAKKDIKEKGQPLFSGIGLAPAPLLMDDED